jgi:hypothetical protein
MPAASFDFEAERGFIEASVDPNEILSWMNEYGQHGRDAEAEGDDEAASQFEELHQEAEDRVVELKAAKIERETPKPPKDRVVRVVETAQPQKREVPVAEARATRRADSRTEPVRSLDQDDSAERAANRAAAERRRADDEELHQLTERARKAEARLAAAEAATARILANQRRAAEAQDQERRRVAKERAEKEMLDKERAAVAAEVRAQAAAKAASAAATTPVARVTTVVSIPEGADAGRPTSSGVNAERTRTTGTSQAAVREMTPLPRMFQERLAEPAPEVASRARATTPQAPATKASPPPTQAPAKLTAAPPSTPTIDPDADLPQLTGADLTSFRNWLAVSQRALAAKLGVEQSTISKGEGRPTTVLPPQLRKALHQAMGEPRADVGGAS